MQHIRRSAWSHLVKSRTGFSSSLNCRDAMCASGLGLTEASPTYSSTTAATLVKKSPAGRNGSVALVDIQWVRGLATYACSSYQLSRKYDIRNVAPSLSRTLSSSASGDKSSETRKEISKTEDPFDAPTYNIPEKPVTFTEGASYSIIILAALGVAAAAAYGVIKELLIQPKEYKIFNIALKRIQNDDQVRGRIGSPITGYGQETRNRSARQRIPHRVWTDENGVEHVEVNIPPE
uniref:Mitochondrial import inner membrane translocase subunit Tim21 n=1 Tax=Kalanchoe fedtschenkoi TaxID=63787 RepID=A0A7N0UPG7_KALFE